MTLGWDGRRGLSRTERGTDGENSAAPGWDNGSSVVLGCRTWRSPWWSDSLGQWGNKPPTFNHLWWYQKCLQVIFEASLQYLRHSPDKCPFIFQYPFTFEPATTFLLENVILAIRNLRIHMCLVATPVQVAPSTQTPKFDL